MYQHFPHSGAGRFIYIHEFYNSHSAHSMAELSENTRSAYQESNAIISCMEAHIAHFQLLISANKIFKYLTTSPHPSPSPELHNSLSSLYTELQGWSTMQCNCPAQSSTSDKLKVDVWATTPQKINYYSLLSMQMYCILSAQCSAYSPYRVLRLEAEEEAGGEVLDVVHALDVPSRQRARVHQVT